MAPSLPEARMQLEKPSESPALVGGGCGLSWDDQCWDRRDYWREKRADADCWGMWAIPMLLSLLQAAEEARVADCAPPLCIHPPIHPPCALFLELERGHPRDPSNPGGQWQDLRKVG